MAEIPLVIVNVQRVGPSTGQPTSPSQGDLMQARWGTHGDHWLIALTPASVPECFELTLRAYALSEKYRVPVVLLMDEVIGHMREKIELPDDYSEIPQAERKQPECSPEEFKAENFFDDYFEYNNMGVGTVRSKVGSDYTDNKMNSYYARINYNFDNRYLLGASFREDGSSRFGLNNQYGFFPSFSAACHALSYKENKQEYTDKVRDFVGRYIH